MGWLKKEKILADHERQENVMIENLKQFALTLENV